MTERSLGELSVELPALATPTVSLCLHDDIPVDSAAIRPASAACSPWEFVIPAMCFTRVRQKLLFSDDQR